MSKRKHILANAFHYAAPSQYWAGMWSHPRSEEIHYSDLRYWTELAKTAERGLLDGIFIADSIGIKEVYGGSPAAVLKSGAMSPNNDPFMAVSAMALVTEHLGFGITANTIFEPPYLLARRFSTLDHYTKGRIAWNIVTGALDTAPQAMGADRLLPHDERYDAADEYMELMYKLWEGSWEDGAVLKDKKRKIYADPAKVHKIVHQGKYFKCTGVHSSEPSPQRTPLLFSAGASGRGIAFAAKHAECVFISTNDRKRIRDKVIQFREGMKKNGRDPHDLAIFLAVTIITSPTEAEARDLYLEYAQYNNPIGNLGIMAGLTGIDFSKYDLDEPITNIRSNAIQSVADALAESGRPVTVRDLAKLGRNPGGVEFIVGSVQQVCDELMRLVEETGIDGLNLVRTVEPEGLRSFVDLVVPELQNRDAYKTAYAEGTLREKLFPHTKGRLPDQHPAARYRGMHE